MLIVKNGLLYDVYDTDKSHVELLCGYPQHIALTADKPQITSDGVDKSVITAKLQDWQGNDIRQAVNVTFDLNGETFDKVTDVNGLASIDFTSLTPGLFELSCNAPGYDSGHVEVTAQ